MIDWTKPIETNGGKKCRYMGSYATCGQTMQVAIVVSANGNETLWVMTDEGRLSVEAPPAVRNVPEKFGAWLNCVGAHVRDVWDSRDQADKYATPDRTACVRVQWQDGEGLA